MSHRPNPAGHRHLRDLVTRAQGEPVHDEKLRTYAWDCPCCKAGADDPQRIYRPLRLSDRGRLTCSSCHASKEELAAALAPLAIGAQVFDLDSRRRRPTVIGEALNVLRSVPAEEYVPAIAGVDVREGRSICCPLPEHDDRTPSFGVRDAVWHCHGCGQGGGIIDFGAAMWDRKTYGDSFRPLVRDIAAALHQEVAA